VKTALNFNVNMVYESTTPQGHTTTTDIKKDAICAVTWLTFSPVVTSSAGKVVTRLAGIQKFKLLRDSALNATPLTWLGKPRIIFPCMLSNQNWLLIKHWCISAPAKTPFIII